MSNVPARHELEKNRIKTTEGNSEMTVPRVSKNDDHSSVGSRSEIAMSTYRLLTASLAILTSAACNPFRHDPAVSVSAEDAMLNSRWHANLASPASLAGAVQMSGSASMAPSPDGNSTNVTLSLTNASPGGLHPWAMHYGQCGARMDNGMFGLSEAYKPLEVESDGHANGTATVPLQTPKTGRYFVVVLASAENSETTVACGNLAPPTQ